MSKDLKEKSSKTKTSNFVCVIINGIRVTFKMGDEPIYQMSFVPFRGDVDKVPGTVLALSDYKEKKDGE